MKKYILVSLCLLGVTLLFMQCKSLKSDTLKGTQTNTFVTITEVVHDTVFKIEKDSSYYQALLECQDNTVVLSKVQTKVGTRLESPIVHIRDRLLTVDCQAKAQELFAQWKSQHKTEKIETTKYVEVEKNLSSWQGFQIWCGRLFLLLLLGLGLGLFLNYKKILS